MKKTKKKTKVEIKWNLRPRRPPVPALVQSATPPPVQPQNVIRAQPGPIPIPPPQQQVTHQNLIGPGNVVEVSEQEFIRMLRNQLMGPPIGQRAAVPGAMPHNHFAERRLIIGGNQPGRSHKPRPPVSAVALPPTPVAGTSCVGTPKLPIGDLRGLKTQLEAFKNAQVKAMKIWDDFTVGRKEKWEEIDRIRKEVLDTCRDQPDSVPAHFLPLATLSKAYHTRSETGVVATHLTVIQRVCNQIDQDMDDEATVLQAGSCFQAAQVLVNAPIKTRPAIRSLPRCCCDFCNGHEESSSSSDCHCHYCCSNSSSYC